MSFQAYIDTIRTRTGKGPEDFRRLARDQGFLAGEGIASGVQATQVTDWLKAEFGLGHGHAMAIYALLKGTKTAA